MRDDRYAVRGRETFERGELIQNWITHQLQIIGSVVERDLGKLQSDVKAILDER
jgi:hypothetical protein